MKIAIIGGGASGMLCAHLLNSKHDITIFEKDSILGGNIRTLNKNVKHSTLNEDIIIDNGVIEFAHNQFPTFFKIMEDLGVILSSFPGNGALYLNNGDYYLGKNLIKTKVNGFLNQSKEYLKLMSLFPDLFLLQLKVKLKPKHIEEYATGELFDRRILHCWMRSLAMYAHSVPYKEIDRYYPAELCMSLFKTYAFGTKWYTIHTGIYTYIEKILESFKGKIILKSKIQGVTRNENKVQIQMANGDLLIFDKIVFASTPDQILKLLKDSTSDEKKRFGAWKSHRIKTIIHTDNSLYAQYPLQYYSEFDIFESSKGDFGYNGYMNRIASLNMNTSYFMGYNIEKLISPKKILHKQIHTTPFYTVEAMRYRKEIKKTNGENNTCYAGAYLYDGLHEGAAISATEVAKIMI